MDPFDWTTSDDFVQRALASGATEDNAWNLYNTKRGGVTRAEFASLWIFWSSSIGRAIEQNPEIIEPPASTEEVIESAAAQLRERQEKRAARDAKKAERRRMTAKLEVGDYVRVTGSHEGGREQSYTGTVRRVNGGTVLVDDAEQTDGAGTPLLHYCATGSIFKTDRRTWSYSEIAGGGEKWQLVEHRSYGDVTLATLIRLPGTLTRIFASQIASDHYNVPSTSDYSGPCEARLALEKWLGAELPRVPNRSDEAHDHARLPGETIHEWNCRMGLA